MRLDSLRKLTAALSQDRSLKLVLTHIVAELARYRSVGLARVWLHEPASACEICPANPEFADKPSSLHLAASAGTPLKSGEDWTRLDGGAHHGDQKVRQIGQRREPILIRSITEENQWIEDFDWKLERIRGFAGLPLMFAGQLIGVVVIFSRTTIRQLDFERLRLLSVAMAGTIVNTRTAGEFSQLREHLESENAYLRVEALERAGGTRILGSSTGIRRVLEQIEMVAPTDATVLILGETGVGKELVARAIHEHSPRGESTLVKVNCTAIPRELFESEFFGHAKGAFSGATSDRMGRFQVADGGSLFLDEVGDLASETQPKLLRVLQDGEYERVGDDQSRHADVRVIAASNHDLAGDVAARRFREDLYYRVSVFPIEVPPLRERKEDIPVLAEHFVEAACQRFNRSRLYLSPQQIDQMQSYEWPGNVRELQNLIERAVITARRGPLRFDIGEAARLRSADQAKPGHPMATVIATEGEMKRRERDNFVAALKLSNGRIYGSGGAAELLGMKPTTLNARIKKLGLSRLSSS